MTTEEKIAYILQTMTELPLDKWSETADHAGRRFYRQVKNDVTFRFYPPTSPGTKPYVTVVRDENDRGEVRQTFYEYNDPKGVLSDLWNRVLDYFLENGKKVTERDIDIIYEELVHPYVKPISPKP